MVASNFSKDGGDVYQGKSLKKVHIVKKLGVHLGTITRKTCRSVNYTLKTPWGTARGDSTPWTP